MRDLHLQAVTVRELFSQLKDKPNLLSEQRYYLLEKGIELTEIIEIRPLNGVEFTLIRADCRHRIVTPDRELYYKGFNNA